MNRIWLKSYPKGMQHDINEHEYCSVHQLFMEACQKHGDHPAFSNFNHTITFAELEQLTRQFACYLQHDLELRKGDRIAIMLPNVIQYPIAVLSAIRLGLVVVNIDPMYTQRELTLQLNDSGAETVIVLENFAREVELALPNVEIKNVLISKVGDCLPAAKAFLLNTGNKFIKKSVPSYTINNAIYLRNALHKYRHYTDQLKEAKLNHDDLAFLQYTGGTTGVPKGVELTHGNIVANTIMCREWVRPALSGPNHRVIAPLPMYHIFCMSINVLTMISLGVENVLITNPRDFSGFCKILRKNRFTGFIAVNTLLRKLMDTPGFEKIDFSDLVLTFAGGMAVTHDVADEWLEKTGCPVSEAYGLSETSPGVASVPLPGKVFTGNIGLPLPSTYIKLLDDDDNEVGVGEMGELCVKGPQVMRGYWQRPDATAEVMTRDGYLRTGDYMSIDKHGYLTVLDRKKDMILVSGFNVFPNEIEDVLNQHPEIVESAAIGIDDREAGQVVKLFVVRSNDSFSKEAIMAYCKEHLTGYKRPKQIEFIEELPKSNVGKILRKELR